MSEKQKMIIGGIYETGCLGRKKWWVYNGSTPKGMAVLERLDWATDSIADKGVLERTGEFIRRKPYKTGVVFCKKFGMFEEPRNAQGWKVRSREEETR